MEPKKLSNKIMFKEPPIDRGSQNTTIFDLLENVGIIPSECYNFIWTLPQMIEFSMLPLILVDCIPFQHHVADLEVLWLSLSVENAL